MMEVNQKQYDFVKAVREHFANPETVNRKMMYELIAAGKMVTPQFFLFKDKAFRAERGEARVPELSELTVVVRSRGRKMAEATTKVKATTKKATAKVKAAKAPKPVATPAVAKTAKEATVEKVKRILEAKSAAKAAVGKANLKGKSKPVNTVAVETPTVTTETPAATPETVSA